MATDLENTSDPQDLSIDKLKLEEIEDLIINFNFDETVNQLNKYYATQTTWEIIKQSRRETSHTHFLSWFFGNKDFNADPNAGPIKRLIVLLLKWSRNQKQAVFSNDLAKSIYNGTFSIISYKVESEKSIYVKSTKPAYGDGSIDIFISVDATIEDKNQKINIVIENKIDAPETTKSFDDKGNLINLNKNKTTPISKVLYQTDAYYSYVTETYKGDINLFVYLKPTDCSLVVINSAECNCKKYIQINYQELLDYIIFSRTYSEENAYRLNDYIKTLGQPSETDNDDIINNSNKKITIMAMENKEKELLRKFFENNEKLIRAAINALGDDELSMNMANNIGPKGRPRRTYTISCKGKEIFTMYGVLEEFIKYRLKKDPSVSVDDINKEINEYLNSKRVNVSDNPIKQVYKETNHFGIVENTNIRYTKEWADSVPTDTFTKFREGVNDQGDSDFQITKIINNL